MPSKCTLIIASDVESCDVPATGRKWLVSQIKLLKLSTHERVIVAFLVWVQLSFSVADFIATNIKLTLIIFIRK